MLNFLNTNSGAIQALSTIALVLVTIYYAYQTKKTVAMMVKQQKSNSLPIVVPEEFSIINNRCNNHHLYCVDFNLANIGNGPAFNIMVELCDDETNNIFGGSVHEVGFVAEKSKNSVHIHIPKESIDSIKYREIENKDKSKEMVGSADIIITYDSLFTKRLKSTRSFSVRKKDGQLLFQPVLGGIKVKNYDF